MFINGAPRLFLKKSQGMTPKLPRQLLWKDLQTMDEFFLLEPINEAFFEVFVTLHEEPFAIKSDEVKVYNEVYYQVTRMAFEHPMPGDLPNYIADIKANMGWNYSAELVMSMAYFLFSLVDCNVRPLNKFFTKAINEKFYGCLFWKPFKKCFVKLKKEGRHLRYVFRPRPCEVDWLKKNYIYWKEITHDYDLLCIEKVINLWMESKSRREVAKLISDSIFYNGTGKNADDVANIKHFIERYFMEGNSDSATTTAQEPSVDYDVKPYQTQNYVLKIELAALRNRICELESENERLTTLLEEKKKKGTARKFTLVQIVEYCKERVEWDDAKSIVAMLNKLLRHDATQEDTDLVDSIEEEFMNRRYGYTYIHEQTVIPKVGNYRPEIKNQNLNMSMPPKAQKDTTPLIDE